MHSMLHNQGTDNAVTRTMTAIHTEEQGKRCATDGWNKMREGPEVRPALLNHEAWHAGLPCCRSIAEDAFGGLQDVLGEADVRPTIPQRVFEWWYPARRQ
jgi:hypothetical protein